MNINLKDESNFLEITRLTLNTKIKDMLALTSVILCNKSTHIEVYSLKLNYLKTISLNTYTNAIIRLTGKLFILVSSDSYIISRLTGDYSDIEFTQISYHKISLPLFTGYYFCNNILILYSFKNIRIYQLVNNRLVENDTPNDFEYYKILFINVQGNILNIIVKDIEDTTILLKYSVSNNRLVLNKKIKKMCTSVFAYNKGYIFIGEGIIWYEEDNKKISESEFGNTRVKSSIIYKDELILSMEDDELITIRCSSSSSLINIKVYNINTFDFLINVDGNILGHSLSGKCHLFELTNKIDIICSLDSICELSKCMELDKSLVFYNTKYKSTLTNLIRCHKTKYLDNAKDITSFYIFKNILILTYSDRTDFIDTSSLSTVKYSIELQFLNFHEYNDILYANSSTILYKINFGTDLVLEEVFVGDDILICSFYKDKFVCYTSNSILQTNSGTLYLEDVSCILYSDMIYISTYNDQYIVFDDLLQEVYRSKAPTYIFGIVHKIEGLFRNIFYDIKNVLWEVNFDKITRLGLYEDIKKLASGDKLYLIGKYLVIFEENKALDLLDINHMVIYNRELYIYIKNEINKLNVQENSGYNYKHEHNNYVYMNKSDNNLLVVDTKGILKFKKSSQKITKCIDRGDIKGIYSSSKKVYSLLNDKKLYTFSYKNMTLTQEIFTKDVINIHKKNIKVCYNEIIINNEVVPYSTGVIKSTFMKGDEILIIDLFKGFYIYNILNKEWFYFPSGKYSLGYLYNSRYIILSEEQNIVVYDRSLMKTTKFCINERLVCISECSLELNKECLYCVTEGNSVWRIYLNEISEKMY